MGYADRYRFFLKFSLNPIVEQSVNVMYIRTDRFRHSFLDFKQPVGLHVNPDNRWMKMIDSNPMV